MMEWDRAKVLEICEKEHERIYLEAWKSDSIKLLIGMMECCHLAIYNNLISYIREEIGRPKAFTVIAVYRDTAPKKHLE